MKAFILELGIINIMSDYKEAYYAENNIDVILIDSKGDKTYSKKGYLYNKAINSEFGKIRPYSDLLSESELQLYKLKQFEQAVQSHLDTTAQSKGYDSILSACSYAGYTNPFQTEGQAFTEWRGNVWAYCYTQIDIFTGTVEEFIATLPKFEG